MEAPAAAWWRSIAINRTALRLLFKSPWKAPFRQSENELLQIWLQGELSATFPMLFRCSEDVLVLHLCRVNRRNGKSK
jgi:hypothetical protein